MTAQRSSKAPGDTSTATRGLRTSSDRSDPSHEPHGHCRVCHVGVHRYPGSKCWLHVNLPLVLPGHPPDVVVTCCEPHGKISPDQMVLPVDLPAAFPETVDQVDDPDPFPETGRAPERSEADWYGRTWPHTSWRPSGPPEKGRGGRPR